MLNEPAIDEYFKVIERIKIFKKNALIILLNELKLKNP